MVNIGAIPKTRNKPTVLTVGRFPNAPFSHTTIVVPQNKNGFSGLSAGKPVQSLWRRREHEGHHLPPTKTISYRIVTEEETKDMLWLCDKFKDGFEFYDRHTSDLQVLQGICHGILSDGIVKDEEITELINWLFDHQHLATFYPYDEITSIILEVIEDGKIDENEKKVLTKYFSEFVELNDTELQKKITEEVKDIKIGGICSRVSGIRFIEKQFCLTGNSAKSKRSEIVALIEEYGGKYVNSISGKTNYLIVGDKGNPCWAYACYGRKVEQALKLRKNGTQILIVHENDFWKEIESRH